MGARGCRSNWIDREPPTGSGPPPAAAGLHRHGSVDGPGRRAARLRQCGCPLDDRHRPGKGWPAVHLKVTAGLPQTLSSPGSPLRPTRLSPYAPPHSSTSTGALVCRRQLYFLAVYGPACRPLRRHPLRQPHRPEGVWRKLPLGTASTPGRPPTLRRGRSSPPPSPPSPRYCHQHLQSVQKQQVGIDPPDSGASSPENQWRCEGQIAGVGNVKETHEMQGAGRSIQGMARRLEISRNTAPQHLKTPEAIARKARGVRPPNWPPMQGTSAGGFRRDHRTVWRCGGRCKTQGAG